ncbi:MAG TPA: energy transducer TonB [Bryobacteraceae bacterium]|nr:energy transducer TonB [Bryobacteraceae bacterium]
MRQTISEEWEIGGILLGRSEPGDSADRRLIIVNDYIPFESEHARGTAFTLSAQDKDKFKRLLRLQAGQGNHPIGFFRTHLRKGLYLDEADFSLVQEFFSSPENVVLLARPERTGPPLGGFFFWEEGSLNRQSTYLTFPLSQKELEESGFSLLHGMPEDVHSHVVAAAPKPKPNKARFAYAGLAAALVLVPLTAWLAERVSAHKEQAPPLLSVHQEGQDLRLSWDAHVASVRNSNSGTLWIADGSQERRVDLSPQLLRAGSYLYHPQTADVMFRMTLAKVAEQGSESIEFVGDHTVTPVSAPPPVEIAKASPLAPLRKPVNNSSDDDADDDSPPVRVSKPVQVQAQPVQSPPSQQPQQQPQQPPAQVAATVPPPSAPPQQAPPPAPKDDRLVQRTRPESTVSVTTQPVEPGRYQQLVQKMPLIRRLQSRSYRGGDEYTPPRVAHEVPPRVPASVARSLHGDSDVEFRVKVDKQGRVRSIETLTRGDGRLIDIAADAVREWRFEPARLRGRPVSSEIYTNLRFHNGVRDVAANSANSSTAEQ